MKSISLQMSAASMLISLASLMAHAAPANAGFAYGSEVVASTFSEPLRQVNVNTSNGSIDVNKGETVDLVSGTVHQAWRFDGVQPEFTLTHAFPQAEHANTTRVYVADHNG